VSAKLLEFLSGAVSMSMTKLVLIFDHRIVVAADAFSPR
jgi:hypothetical protein